MSAAGRLVAPILFALVAAATVGLLVYSQGARTALVVDQVDLSENFDPRRGQRAAIRFRLTQDEPAGTVEVIDAEDRVVDVLAEDEPLGDFEIHRFRWGGEGADPGRYRVRLLLDSLGREVVLPEEIVLRRPRDG